MRYITQSELKTFRECKRKWWLTYYRRLVLKPEYQKPGATWLGLIVHDLLDHHDNGHDWRTYLDELTEASAAIDGAREQHEFAGIIVEGYLEWLEDSGADQWLETISTEETVEAQLYDDLVLRGRLDKLVRNTATGEVLFIDYKTVGNFHDIPKRAQVDEQFLHYTTILQLRDGSTDVSGGIWRMLEKSKRTDRTIKPDGTTRDFYQEHGYSFNKHQLASYAKRLEGMIDDIEAVETRLERGEDHLKVVYPTPNENCSWKCPFYAVCPMFDDGSRVNDLLDEFYEEGDPFRRYESEDENL